MAKPLNSNPSITVNQVPIQWNDGNRGFKFFGREAILFWKTPSLVSMLEPLRHELGDELYSVLVAYEASKGTYEDYHSMVGTMGEGFEEGFLNWGKAVSGAGWGTFHLVSMDWQGLVAVIEIDDPWESKVISTEHVQDKIPFLSGKISGIFSHAFKTNCRSEIISSTKNENGCERITLRVFPSAETLEQALEALHEKRKLSPDKQLKVTNSALKKSEQRLLDVLDTIASFIWEVDASLTLGFVTPRASQMLGYSISELNGKLLTHFIHPEDVALLTEALQSTAVGKEVVARVKVRMIDKSGATHWIDIKAKPLRDISGHHRGFLGSAKDITTEVRLKAELEEQQMKSAQSEKMASLGRMAAGIAHEINNPLSVIIANAWKIKSQLSDGPLDASHAAKYLQNIESTAKHIESIIKSMRSFARDNAAEPFAACSIESVLERTLMYCRASFISEGIELRLAPVDSCLKVECRDTQISQVLLNLLNNAFDAARDLDEKWVELKVEETADAVNILVTDSGKGIPQEHRSKIMEPFFTTKDPGQGTGQGLSISLAIAQSHHGKLYLDQTCPNTRFVLSLPKFQQKKAA